MFDIGFQELLVIMVLALLVFGPDKLPELGRRLGRAMREFRRASDEFRATIETNLHLSEDTLLPPTVRDSGSVGATGTVAAPGSVAADGPVAGIEGTAPPSMPAGHVSDSGGNGSSGASLPDGEPLDPFWARRGGRLLHRGACGWRIRVPEGDRIAFKTAAEASELNFMPCPVCDPREAEITS